VAFVFQAQSLLAPLSALENAALPLLLLGAEPDLALGRARDLLERLGSPTAHREAETAKAHRG